MSEPVAWMLLGLEDRKPKLINPQVIDHLEGTWIPLYTHPMRELTNDEIMDVANEVFNTYKNWGYYQIDFARAILAKTCEK
jgi:hypothetical protein